MKYKLFVLLIFNTCLLLGQKAPTGATPITPVAATGTTRAVVIGISNYQNLPPLKYAHRDAEEFAAFLQSPAGGNLPPANIRLLTNEKATGGAVNMELYWLLQDSKEGDQAIIYFSGHGDMEQQMMNQLGFLLCYDSPSFAYFSGGSVQVTNLQEVVSTLTLMKKTKVLLITDACRAGKLAGNPINGTGATTANLQQFANAVKILSCQPTEFSLEGTEWGDGRGAFSYHLVDGLYGMADSDNDGQVKLREIDRYLDDRVPKQTSPQPQNPVIMGDKDALLSRVDSLTLATVLNRKKGELPSFSPGDMRGFEETLLAKADSNIQKTYQAFLAAIEQKHLMEPEGASANDYYEQLIHEPGISQMHGMLTRNFVAALMDDAQQWINKLLESTLIGGEWKHPKGYGVYLAKAAELLGEGHYLYGNLKGKEYLFRARDLWLEKNGPSVPLDSVDLARYEQLLRKGLEYDEKAPYLYYHLSYSSPTKSKKLESIEFLKKAVELAPSWVRAHASIGFRYNELGDWKTATEWYRKADELDVEGKCLGLLYESQYRYLPNLLNHDFEGYKKGLRHDLERMRSNTSSDLHHLMWLTFYYYLAGFPAEAEPLYERNVNENWGAKTGGTQMDEALATLGWMNYIKGDEEKAATLFRKTLEWDSLSLSSTWSYWGLALLAYRQGDTVQSNRLFSKCWSIWYTEPINVLKDGLHLACIYGLVDESIQFMQKAAEHYHDRADLPYHLARLYLEQKNDYEKGVPLLEKAVQLDSTFAYALYHLAAAYAHLDKNKEALDHLEKALENGYDDPEGIEQDERWKEVRGTKRYKELIRKYAVQYKQ